jgi:long-subunit fatty acid transport protein
MNTTGSLLDAYVAQAAGHKPKDLDDFSTGLAYDAFLINPLGDSTKYNHVISHYGELQTRTVQSKGAMGEIAVSFGGNYKDRVFLGATLGIVRVRYYEEYAFRESDEKDTINEFKSFTYRQNLLSNGTGINFKVGVIVKATDWLRLGAAVHTPTKISMADSYTYSFNSDLENNHIYKANSPEGNFNYTITTPFRAIGSIGVIINKRGLLNAEYEYVNYKNGYLSSTPDVFSDVNSYIRKQYVSAGNIRIGGEVRFDPISIRLGYAIYGSPFGTGINKAANRSSYTAGIGYRKDSFFMDAAFVLTAYRDYSYLYDPTINTAVVKNDYTATSLIFTIGFRF